MTWHGHERRQGSNGTAWIKAIGISLLVPLLTLVFLYGRLNERVDNLVQQVDRLQQTIDLLAVRSNTTVWALERQPLPPRPWRGKGPKPTRMRRDQTHQPVTVKQLAQELPETAWREVVWREGSKETLRSRFAALRVRPAYGDDRRGGLQPEQWLLIEWPSGAVEPAGYWLARLPVKISLKRLVGISKHRWVIERDYEELKSELGLAHYEGRNWRGFHHHATLCIAAYGFLIAERSRFSPSAHIPDLGLRSTPIPADFRPRGAASARPTA